MRDILAARVLVVGVGGLGCPASLALAKSGLTRLTLVDADKVDPTNLHRQLWHRGSDVGRPKVESAADRLRATFPGLHVETVQERVGPANVEALFRRHDLVIDATDGIEDKFLLSDASVLTGIPLVYGGVLRMQGQAMLVRPAGPCLRCLFEEPPPAEVVQGCSEAGVLGSMAGVLGALQALIASAALRAGRAALAEKGDRELLVTFDGQTLAQRKIEIRRAGDCAACGASARPTLRGSCEGNRC